jgi:hypothetical protein
VEIALSVANPCTARTEIPLVEEPAILVEHLDAGDIDGEV